MIRSAECGLQKRVVDQILAALKSSLTIHDDDQIRLIRGCANILVGVGIGANVGVIVAGIVMDTGAMFGEAVSSGPHLPHVRRHSKHAPVI